MKLLYLADIRFPMERANGIQTVETAHALARRGVSVDLVVRRSDERSDEACLEFFGLEPHENLRLRRVPTPAGRFSYLKRAFTLLLDAGRWDALFTRDLLLADLAVQARRLHRLPVFYEAHTVSAVFARDRAALYRDASAPSGRKLARLDARERRVCREAAGIVAITGALGDALAVRHGALSPVGVVPDGCRLPEAPPSAYAPHDPLRVYYVGQLYPWKGVDVLVRAMKDVEGAELVVVGGLPPEPDLERVRGLARELGVDDRVVFRGYLPPPQLPGERAGADAFVIPLLDSETARLFTSPLKLFESMAARRPVVASDLPSIREVLAHEVNALLVPAGDPATLAGALGRLASDPDLAGRLADRAYEDVQDYSWDRRAERLASFIERNRKKGSDPFLK